MTVHGWEEEADKVIDACEARDQEWSRDGMAWIS